MWPWNFEADTESSSKSEAPYSIPSCFLLLFASTNRSSWRPLFKPAAPESLWFDATVGSPQRDEFDECLFPFEGDEPSTEIDSVTVLNTLSIAWFSCLGTSTSTSRVTILFLSYSLRTLKPTWYLWLPCWTVVAIGNSFYLIYDYDQTTS